jgi:Planctomycete cytochrome C
MKQKQIALVGFLGWAAAAIPLLAADKFDISKVDLSKLPPPAQKQGVTYAADIRPLFEASCVRCHGQERPKGGLNLTTLGSVLRGGKDGKVVVPGDGKQSVLTIAVARVDDDLAMPPKHRPGRHGRGGFGGPNGPPGGGPDNPNGGFGRPNGEPPPGGPGFGPGGPHAGGPSGRPGGFGPPPKPLTAEQVGLIRAWIDQGAK